MPNFLEHDMTPVDPIVFYRPSRHPEAQPAKEDPNPRLPRYDPRTMQRTQHESIHGVRYDYARGARVF